LITSLSEETLIAFAVFAGTGMIYVLRKFSFLNARINDFEMKDIDSRESIERDLLIMNGLIDEIRHEYKDTKDNVEDELVQHELIGLNMAPKFQELGNQISNVLGEQSDSISGINRNLSDIESQVTTISNPSSMAGIEQINSLIPKLVEKLNTVNQSVKEDSNNVAILLQEVSMIKRAIGVE
jgi:methyl-accepting chemotaxis protein